MNKITVARSRRYTRRAARQHRQTHQLRRARPKARPVDSLIPLTDVVGVVDAFLAWPVAHEAER